MKTVQDWKKINQKINSFFQDKPIKIRSDINKLLMDHMDLITTEKSLGLIYDKYGNQCYEKTSMVKDYLSCKKMGLGFTILENPSNLIETNFTNKFRTDFINYDMLPRIKEVDLKNNLGVDSDFSPINKFSYFSQELEHRKKEALSETIDSFVSWFNTDGQKNIQKIDNSFVGFLK